MSAEPNKRPPPQLIRVPLPEGLVFSPLALSLLAGTVFVAGVITFLLGLSKGSFAAWMGSVMLVVGVFLLAWWPHRAAQRRKLHAAYIERLRAEGSEPVAVALAERWTRSDAGVSDKDVREVLAGMRTAEQSPAQIVCLGDIDVPEVGEVFFEPEIITPTRSIGGQLYFIPIAAMLVTFWLLQVMHVIPGRAVNLGGFGYFLAMGFSAAVVWVWRSTIRPTYIRMAPGVIQVLEFRYGRGKPVIRSYAMDRGTLAVLRGKAAGKKIQGLSLTLLRDGQRNVIQLSQMRKCANVLGTVWQALLSTAPTPPLSDEGLLG
ncbi:MAG: hypothetical protein KKB50_12770 [Planctomycetes bacterium]|nr:hypothetical protein [Planctomycetota bacterium]